MPAETTSVPETPVVPDPKVGVPTPELSVEQLLQQKIQDASAKINTYLEAAGLEMRVIHTISLIPKPTKI